MRLCNRPFESIEEQTEVFLSNWNSVVSDNDEVFVLGDVGFTWGEKEEQFYRIANGKKRLIVGNHDETILSQIESSKTFDSCNFILNVEDEGENIVLCHYPLMDWEGIDIGWLHFYGHIHNKALNDIFAYYKNRKAYNVSIDVTKYTPMTKEQIKEQKLCI